VFQSLGVSASGEKPEIDIETAHAGVKLIEPAASGPVRSYGVMRSRLYDVIAVCEFPGCRIASRRAVGMGPGFRRRHSLRVNNRRPAWPVAVIGQTRIAATVFNRRPSLPG